MVNQWYTLILNKAATDISDIPWRRYVIGTYTVKRYDTVQSRVRAALLGSSSELWTQAYNIDAALRLVDDPRYLKLASDPHTAPAVSNPSSFEFGETLTGHNTEASDAYGGYIFLTEDTTNVPIRRSWRVRADADSYLITDMVSAGSFRANLNDCRLADDIKFVTARTPAVGAEWTLTVYTRPTPAIPGILSRLSECAAELDAMSSSSQYPMATYRKLINSSNTADMLAGVLLAFDLYTRIT